MIIARFEQQNLLADIEEVVVYGKIPRCGISIPTTAGAPGYVTIALNERF